VHYLTEELDAMAEFGYEPNLPGMHWMDFSSIDEVEEQWARHARQDEQELMEMARFKKSFLFKLFEESNSKATHDYLNPFKGSL
jgi:hypothetical protein